MALHAAPLSWADFIFTGVVDDQLMRVFFFLACADQYQLP